MPLMWFKCLILILKMAWAKLISFLNGLISKISQNKPVKPVKFFSSFPDAEDYLYSIKHMTSYDQEE
jgi:hypothetical protein